MAENKSKDVIAENRQVMHNAEQQKQTLRNVYTAEEKVPMYLSPMYRGNFGRVMRVMLNGVSIYFPVDGTTHNIPQSFADEIARRRMAADNMMTKQNRMADISNNAERSPGELNVF